MPIAHGQQGGLAFAGDGFLHGHGVADGGENLAAAGRIGEGHAVGGALAQEFGGGLVHLEDVAFGVGDDDGLKDGLEHGVGELKLHLAASGFGFAQVAQTNGNAVQFGGDDAKAVAADPGGAVLQVALRDPVGIARQGMDGPQDSEEGNGGGNDGRDGQGRSQEGCPAAASGRCAATASQTVRPASAAHPSTSR